MSKKACVIGSGLGGLSLALRLAKLNLDVDVYEQNGAIGGKVNEIKEKNFRFDTGASLVTMPFVFEELFKDVGESLESYLEFKQLEIICKYFYQDGTVINAYSDVEKFAEEIELKTRDSKSSVIEYLDYCRKIYDRRFSGNAAFVNCRDNRIRKNSLC